MSPVPNAASVALIRAGTVLLIQRAYAPYRYLWTLPGGSREPGETITQCAAREIAEELGLIVTDLKPVIMQALGKDRSFRLEVFTSTTFSGNITPSDEIRDQCWITPADLGTLRTTSRLDLVLETAFAVCR